MNRKLLSLLIAGLTTGAASITLADNVPTIYGKVNVTLNKYDFDRITNPTTSYTAQDDWKLESNSSRLGVKGDYGIGGNNKIIYKIEYEIYPDSDKQGDGSSPFKQRNTYAGLQGDWGTLFAGKNDTPLKAIAADTVQLFKDLPLTDYKYFLVGENRENNIIQYTTPNFSGFGASLQIEPGEDSGSDGQLGTGTTKNTNDGLFDKYSVAVTYKINKLYLALAHDNNIVNTDTTRAVAQYGIGPVTIGALWQTSDRHFSTVYSATSVPSPATLGGVSAVPGNNSTVNATTGAQSGNGNPITDFNSSNKSQDGYALSAAWKIQDFTIKGQYGHSTTEPNAAILSDTKAKNYAVGVDYKLNDNSKVFAYYAAFDTEGADAVFDGTLKDKTYAIGYDFKF